MTALAPHRLGGLLREPLFLRVWLIGGLSGIARWLELLVVGVFAFETTGSPFLVALLVILRMLPLAVFGPLVGTFADRLAPRPFLASAMLLASAASGLVALAFALDLARYWHVAIVTFVTGAVWTTDMPLRRRLLGDAAGSARLAPAMSLDSATNNGTRMLGPLSGGLIYQWLGTGGAFTLSMALYALCVLLALGLPVGRAADGQLPGGSRVLGDLLAAYRYATGDRDVLRILLITVVFNLWGFPFVSMIPVIGSEELGLSAGWIGGLAALEGLGSLTGALVIVLLAPTAGYRRIYYFGTLTFLALIFVTGWMSQALPAALLLLTVGLAGSCFTTMQSTLIYTVAPPAMRGRLFGLLVLAIGSGLIGFFNVGLMGEWYGGSTAIRIIAAEGIFPLLLIGLGWRQLRAAG